MSAPAGDSGRRMRRWATLIGGYSLLVIGGVLLVLPGPGLPLIIGGLALLEREEAWARRLKLRLQQRVQRARRRWRSARPDASAHRPAATPPPLARNAAE